MSQSPKSAKAEDLAVQIREAIAAGELALGSRMPSVSEYVALGYGRGAVVDALERLRNEGLIVRRQGAGSFVRGPDFARIQRRSPGRLAKAQWGAGNAIQDHDTLPRPRTVGVVVADVVPPTAVGALLGVDPGTPVLSRFRRFLVDKRPVQLATSYLPTELTRGTRIEHTDTGPGGTYARLAEAGFGPTRFTERIIGRAPTPFELNGDDGGREGLGLRKGAMVHEVTREAYASDRCVEVTVMVLDADVYELVYEFPA